MAGRVGETGTSHQERRLTIRLRADRGMAVWHMCVYEEATEAKKYLPADVL